MSALVYGTGALGRRGLARCADVGIDNAGSCCWRCCVFMSGAQTSRFARDFVWSGAASAPARTRRECFSSAACSRSGFSSRSSCRACSVSARSRPGVAFLPTTLVNFAAALADPAAGAPTSASPDCWPRSLTLTLLAWRGYATCLRTRLPYISRAADGAHRTWAGGALAPLTSAGVSGLRRRMPALLRGRQRRAPARRIARARGARRRVCRSGIGAIDARGLLAAPHRGVAHRWSGDARVRARYRRGADRAARQGFERRPEGDGAKLDRNVHIRPFTIAQAAEWPPAAMVVYRGVADRCASLAGSSGLFSPANENEQRQRDEHADHQPPGHPQPDSAGGAPGPRSAQARALALAAPQQAQRSVPWSARELPPPPPLELAPARRVPPELPSPSRRQARRR